MSGGIENPFSIIARYQAKAPVDVEAIARDLGIKIYAKDMGEDVFGSLVRDRTSGGWSGYAIYLNRDNHPNRRRFTLAHEIAHFVLHKDLVEAGIIDDIQYRSRLSNVHETQANQLAADILMPRTLVEREAVDNEDGRPLWARFMVSEAAMDIRLKSLHLLPV
jgi:Zn-dependent peptidase ImmA (M78 family)